MDIFWPSLKCIWTTLYKNLNLSVQMLLSRHFKYTSILALRVFYSYLADGIFSTKKIQISLLFGILGCFCRYEGSVMRWCVCYRWLEMSRRETETNTFSWHLHSHGDTRLSSAKSIITPVLAALVYMTLHARKNHTQKCQKLYFVRRKLERNKTRKLDSLRRLKFSQLITNWF